MNLSKQILEMKSLYFLCWSVELTPYPSLNGQELKEHGFLI